MDELTGKVAVITGGASGLGLAMAERFAAEGMDLVLADRDEGGLAAAAEGLRADGAAVLPVVTDVTVATDVDDLAAAAIDRFGAVHLLCNNAGVLRPGSTWEQPLEDWEVVMRVNVWGVIHGLRSFVPAMLAHGQDCHVVNTASAAGLLTTAHMASYTASKFAVLAISETLAEEVALLPSARMGISVLCPGGVATNIYRAEVARQADRAAADPLDPETARRFEVLADPDRPGQGRPEWIADLVLDAVRRRQFYVLALQPHLKDLVTARLARVEAALADAPDMAAG